MAYSQPRVLAALSRHRRMPGPAKVDLLQVSAGKRRAQKTKGQLRPRGSARHWAGGELDPHLPLLVHQGTTGSKCPPTTEQ